MKLVSSILVLLIALVALPSRALATVPEMTVAQARQRVIEIVNQPVRHLPRTDEASEFSPGWFHEGAIEPDYRTVDVRKTQEFPYRGYVTSDLKPSEMFVGDELEFNAMTKFFYTDRTLPKKRLSEDEMLEINRLYRIIGQGEHGARNRLMTIGLIAFGILLVVAMLLLARRLS